MPMWPVVPQAHACPLLRSKEPRSALTPVLQIILCYSSPSLLVIRISEIKNAKLSRGHVLRLWLHKRLDLTNMHAHLKGQTSHEARIPPVLPMIMCYSLESLLMI